MPTKTCKISGKEFTITDEDLVFYKKMGVPEPTLCPEERQRRRLVWQNMSNLYHRTCDATGKKIISNFSSDKNYIIYDQEYWWSDKWDFQDYGKDFDFERGFFEQWGELFKTTPLPSLFTNFQEDENSNYTNFAGYDKNCYLVFHADFNEDCYYATGLKNSKNAVDSLNVFDVEQSYQCIDCKDCFDIKYCQDCNNCSESWFLRNCTGCKNCFGSMNLENKQYYLFGKNIGKEKYEKFIEEFESGKQHIIELLHQKFIDFQKTQVHKSTHGLRNENCIGDHLFDCYEVEDSFDVKQSRNMKFCERIYNGPNSDCYDVDQFGAKISKIYESANIGVDCYNTMFSLYSYNLINVLYSIFCFNCEECFGCIGLKNQKFCIFNKEYSEEEYFELKNKIIEHMSSPLLSKEGLGVVGNKEGLEVVEWGEFFPIELAPFGYNETVAQEYYPLSKEEVIQKGYIYKEQEKQQSSGKSFNIPNNIADIDETILEEVLECMTCNKNYKIVKQELAFYQKQELPIPRKCSNCRHLERMKLRNPRALFGRNCNSCSIEIQSTFCSEREERIYCEECYEKEVY